jgi:beta-lactamase superfamily II metal-dependent hydrolase
MGTSMIARLLLAVAAIVAVSAVQARTTLDIYVVDVEGGNAVLFVTPAGESVLIDTGNLDGAARDAGRIMEAASDAGVSRIDHLIITHWHADHFGGVSELARRIPIREYIDHGPNAQPGAAADQFLANVYPELTKAAVHRVAKPGDRLPLNGVDWRIVASAGAVLPSPLPGAGARNPECAAFEPADNNAEDPMSVGSYITFGRFRTLHLGDLTRNMEFKLMCPATLLPPVQLLLGMHHGQDSSNSPVVTHALRPTAAIMNDGTRKGGQPYTMKSIYTAPGFRDLWQIHFSLLSGQEYTTPGLFIANQVDNQPDAMPIQPMTPPQPGPGTPPPPAHNGKAYWIKVSARADGTFTVTNARNGFSKTYAN